MKKITALMAFVLLFGLILVACERSAASTVVTPTNPELNFPINTAPMIEDIVHMTQTALAGAGGTLSTPAPMSQGTAQPTQASQPHEVASPTATVTQVAPTATSTTTGKIKCVSDVYLGNDHPSLYTFGICAVVKDTNVTIQTNRFPPNTNFTVRMGASGTHGEGGIVVGTTNSGKGGTMQATYAIPNSLKGSTRIDMKIEFPDHIHYAFNFFWNKSTP